MHLLINYEQADIDFYNKKFQLMTENIRDFVLLHYITDKKDSLFWKELKLNLPQSLADNLKKWKYRLPLEEDFAGKYLLFNESNFGIILKELNLINTSALKKEYNMLAKNIRLEIETRLKRITDTSLLRPFSHKRMIKDFVDGKKVFP